MSSLSTWYDQIDLPILWRTNDPNESAEKNLFPQNLIQIELAIIDLSIA